MEETVPCILVIFYILWFVIRQHFFKEGSRQEDPLLDIAIHYYLFSVVTFVATKFLVFIS